MKKIITLNLILISISMSVLAQPIITSAYNPIFNDTYVYKIVDDTSTAIPGQSGAGVVWNLTTMHGLLTTRQYDWIQTANTNDASIFGANSNITARIIQTGFSPRYEYYDVGPSFTGDMKKVGSHIDFAITNFFGGFMQFDYPMTYGQMCVDSMNGSTGVANVHGIDSTFYDGYGTLQLEAQSGGNFANVARLKVVENFVVDYGPIETHHTETYYWMDHSTANMMKQPIAIIFTHDWVDLNGTTQREKYALMRQILFINGVPQLKLNSSNVMVSPNPFQNEIRFLLPGVDAEINIAICDIAGRTIKEVVVEKSMATREESMKMDDLLPGIYFARISSTQGSVVQKIVKQ